MPRYIDADRFEVVTSQRHSEDFIDGMDYILDLIDKAPTEDVVPRSEMEKLQDVIFMKEDLTQKIAEERNQYAIEVKALKDELDQAKQEVAREIFEEIENFAKEDIRQRQKYLDTFYGKNSKFHDTRSNWLGGKIDGIKEFMEECIAKLKKKYIGE